MRRAECLGYDSVWVPHGVGRDALILLARYAAETSRIGLGAGVVPILPRHPVALAQEALTLSEITSGRFRLGIGVSHRPLMQEAFGLSMPDPLGAMREYVGALRAALRGDHGRFDGSRYAFRSMVRLPTPAAAPAIYLAGLAPAMLELAGEIADGVVFWLCSPAYIAEVGVPALERGRQRAGKPLSDLEMVAAVPVALTTERRQAEAVFKRELVRYLALPFYRQMFAKSGHGESLRLFDETGEVSDTLAAAVGRAGTATELEAYVGSYRRAGVTLPAIRPIGWSDAPWCEPTVDAAHNW